MASVYLKRRTWYLRVMDASSRWRSFATRAATKTEARRLAFEMERHLRTELARLTAASKSDGPPSRFFA